MLYGWVFEFFQASKPETAASRMAQNIHKTELVLWFKKSILFYYLVKKV